MPSNNAEFNNALLHVIEVNYNRKHNFTKELFLYNLIATIVKQTCKEESLLINKHIRNNSK